MAGGDVGAFALRHLADQRQTILCDWTEAGLPRDYSFRSEHRRQPLADRLEAIDFPRIRGHGGRLEGQGHLGGEGGDVGTPVGTREDFDCHDPDTLLVIFEEQGIRRDIFAGVINQARAPLPKDRGQRQPRGGCEQPRSHCDHHGVRIQTGTIDLNAATRHMSVNT